MPAGSLCPGVPFCPLLSLWSGSHQFLQPQPEGKGVREQTKIIPADSAGSVITFGKGFPFIKATHERLVVVGRTLHLPDAPTAFGTHLIKQRVNMQLVPVSCQRPSQLPEDRSNFKYPLYRKSPSTETRISENWLITYIKNFKYRIPRLHSKFTKSESL